VAKKVSKKGGRTGKRATREKNMRGRGTLHRWGFTKGSLRGARKEKGGRLREEKKTSERGDRI